MVQPPGRRRPGTVAGLELAHKKYGKLPWKDVVAPALKLAAEGFVIDEQLASSLNWIVSTAQVTPELCRVLGKNGGKDDWKNALAVEDEQLVDWSAADETVTTGEELGRKR